MEPSSNPLARPLDQNPDSYVDVGTRLDEQPQPEPGQPPAVPRRKLEKIEKSSWWPPSENAKKALKWGGIALAVIVALGGLIGGLYYGGQFPAIKDFFTNVGDWLKDLMAQQITIGEALYSIGLPSAVLGIIIPLGVIKGPDAAAYLGQKVSDANKWLKKDEEVPSDENIEIVS